MQTHADIQNLRSETGICTTVVHDAKSDMPLPVLRHIESPELLPASLTFGHWPAARIFGADKLTLSGRCDRSGKCPRSRSWYPSIKRCFTSLEVSFSGIEMTEHQRLTNLEDIVLAD